MFSLLRGFQDWDTNTAEDEKSSAVLSQQLDLTTSLYNDLYESTPIFQFTDIDVTARNKLGIAVPVSYTIVNKANGAPVLFNGELMSSSILFGNNPVAGSTDNQYKFRYDGDFTMRNIFSFMGSRSYEAFESGRRAFKHFTTINVPDRSECRLGGFHSVGGTCVFQPADGSHPTGVFIFPACQTDRGIGMNLSIIENTNFRDIAIFFDCVKNDALINIAEATQAYLYQAQHVKSCVPFSREVVSPDFPPLCLAPDRTTEIVAIPLPLAEYIFSFYETIFNLTRTMIAVKNQSKKHGLDLIVKSKYGFRHVSLAYTVRILHNPVISGALETTDEVKLREDDQKHQRPIPNSHLLMSTCVIKHFKLQFDQSPTEIVPAVWDLKLQQL